MSQPPPLHTLLHQSTHPFPLLLSPPPPPPPCHVGRPTLPHTGKIPLVHCGYNWQGFLAVGSMHLLCCMILWNGVLPALLAGYCARQHDWVVYAAVEACMCSLHGKLALALVFLPYHSEGHFWSSAYLGSRSLLDSFTVSVCWPAYCKPSCIMPHPSILAPLFGTYQPVTAIHDQGC